MARRDSAASDALGHALLLAAEAHREHLARGGMPFSMGGLGQGLPGASAASSQSMPGSRMSLSSPVAVLAPSMAHSYLRHALRMRPHFDDGGDAGDGGGDNGGQGGNDGGYGGAGYGAGAADAGGFGIGGFGGAVGEVSRGDDSNHAGDYGGRDAGSTYGGSYGGEGEDTSTTMGAARSDIGSLGSDNAGYGTGFGMTGRGMSDNSTTMGNAMGSLGSPSDSIGGGYGIATGAGLSGSFGNSSDTAGFSNFGAPDAGLASSQQQGYGSISPYGFSGPSPTGLGFGDHLGSFSPASTSSTTSGAYGDLSGVGGFGSVASGYGSFSPGISPSTGAAYGAGNMMGLRAAAGLSGGVGGDADGSGSSPFGGLGGVSFGQNGSAPQGGLGATAAGVPGVGGDTTGDPANVDGAPALTVHPGFAPGVMTGDEPPAELGNQQAVENFSLANLAANFGADYGAQYGLPANFSFHDPAAVAAVVGAGINQESSMNPAAVNPASLATGLNQMLGTGKWSNANPGPYSGLASDPAADRLSSMLGNVASPYGGNPASLDPRAVGTDQASYALGNLPGTFTNQEAYGLAQLATNPMYAGAFAAIQNPNRPIAGMEAAYTKSFENPGADEANLVGRENTAQSLYGIAKQQIAGLGGVGGPPSISYASDGTPTGDGSVSEDPGLQSALAYAASLGNLQSDSIASSPSFVAADMATRLGNPAFAAMDLARNTLANNGSFSVNDPSSDEPAEKFGVTQNAPPSAFDTEGPSPVSYGAPTYAAGYTPNVAPAAIPGTASPYSKLGYGPGSQLKATNADVAAAMAAGAPTFQAYDLARNYIAAPVGSVPTENNFTVYGGPETTSESIGQSIAADPGPVSSTTTAPPNTSTPSYFPGEKSFVKTAINAAVSVVPGLGLVNGISGLLGGPSVGGYITDHSTPGSVDALGGSGSRPDLIPASSYQTPSAAATVPTSAIYTSPATSSIATAAYLAALDHMTAGPAARKATPVPLIAPTYSTAPLYDPMSDPAVLAALANSRSYG